MILKKSKNDNTVLTTFGLVFIVLLVAAQLVMMYSSVLGLIGIGSVLLISGIFYEMNADAVWKESIKRSKKNKKNTKWWNKPTYGFYLFNVFVLWPFIILLGIFSLVTAYTLLGIMN